MILLALDPGIRHPACALFRDGLVTRASRVALPTRLTSLAIGERCSRIADLIIEWVEDRIGAADLIGEFVCELPQIYTASKSKGDPNNLVPLAVLGGMVEGRVRALNRALSVRLPKPAEWVGQLPKEEDGDPWNSPRGRRVRSRLSDGEFAAVVPSHDSVDAVGLGLWGCGRFERRRVYARE